MTKPTRRRRGGYVLLVVLVVMLALALVVGMSLRLGGNERRAATIERDRTQALALAEVGVARMHAYLLGLAERQPDLDLALDPLGDTTCVAAAPTLTLGGGQGDDHRPPFTDGAPVVTGPAGRAWQQVGLNDGSYLVRVDDDADDALATLPANVTGNTGACVEGDAFTVGHTPVRDRNNTVVVTSVGVYPGTDADRARATRALQVTLGPPPPMGLIANGDIDMNGASHICGAAGSISATGNVVDSCLCGTACPGGTPCATNEVCDAHAGGATCNTSASGGGGACLASEPVQAAPRVSPWDVRNLPPACAGAPCSPFYYLRWDDLVGTTKVFMWNYGAIPADALGTCADPGRWGRLCHPLDTLATCPGFTCWSLAYDATAAGGTADHVRWADAAAGLGTVPPPVIVPAAGNPKVWEAKVAADAAGEHGLGCAPAVAPPYPWPAGFERDFASSPTVTFEMEADGSSGERLPRGTWFVEGNVRWKRDAPDCASLPPGWGLTLLALGDLTIEGDATFRPTARRPVAAVAGRDFEVRTGNTDVISCTPGAFLVHEQFEMGGNTTLEGQVVVDNRSNCSDELSGVAVRTQGNSTIVVDQTVIPSGPALVKRSWAETAW